MTKTKNRLRKIRSELEEKSDENKEFTRQQLDRIIEDKAGFERRTKKKYRNILKDRQIISYDGSKYKLEKTVEKSFDEDVDYSADKKNVTVTLNSDAVEAAERYNLNKSEFFNRELIKKVSNLEEDIKEAARPRVEDQEDVPFIKDLILEDAYLARKNEEKRKELYRDHFGPRINEFALKDLRKTAANVAEEIGVLEKPDGV